MAILLDGFSGDNLEDNKVEEKLLNPEENDNRTDHYIEYIREIS